MTTDLERAYAALSGKRAEYDRLWRYYDGDQPLTYANERLREIFAGLGSNPVFTQNWAAVVIDACVERIHLDGLGASDEGQDAVLERMWTQLQLDGEADDAHLAALVTGESFLVVWPDVETGEPDAYYNDPRLCHVFYDADNPRRPRFAAKWWVADDDITRLTLYYPDRLEYYSARSKQQPQSASGFILLENGIERNPYDVIPVFHFRRSGRRAASDLHNVIPIQNGINKLLSDMMVAAEYGAFKQRYIISNVETQGKLANAPNTIWEIPAGDGAGQSTSVGEFSPTDLGNYLDAIRNLAGALAAITHTPRHFLLGESGVLSGEALIAMEAPLNAKAQERIDRFAPTWKEVGAFLLRLSGSAVRSDEITPQFRLPETVQPRTEAEIAQILRAIGIPLATILRRQGWSDAELELMAQDSEAAASGPDLANLLLQAERAFNAGEDAP
jgi:hypothetical protein